MKTKFELDELNRNQQGGPYGYPLNPESLIPVKRPKQKKTCKHLWMPYRETVKDIRPPGLGMVNTYDYQERTVSDVYCAKCLKRKGL